MHETLVFVACSGEDAPYSDDVIIKREQYRADSNHATFFMPPGVLNGKYFIQSQGQQIIMSCTSGWLANGVQLMWRSFRQREKLF